MGEQQGAVEVAEDEEDYAGASLDTVNVPDDDIAILEDMAKPAEEEPAAKEPEPEKEDKRSLYKVPRNKLVKQWHEANEAKAAAEARGDILEQEKISLAEELETLRKTATPEPDEEEKELLEKREQAQEDSDLEEYSIANDALMDYRYSKSQQAEKPAAAPEPKQAAPAAAEQEVTTNPSAQAWMDRNEWFGKPENAHLAKYAEQVQDDLLADGMSYGDELYQKLDESMAPFIDAVKPKEEEQAEEPGKPRHLMAPTRADVQQKTKPKKGELSNYDRQTMRRFKLDPDNAKHKTAYLKRKGA